MVCFPASISLRSTHKVVVISSSDNSVGKIFNTTVNQANPELGTAGVTQKEFVRSEFISIIMIHQYKGLNTDIATRCYQYFSCFHQNPSIIRYTMEIVFGTGIHTIRESVLKKLIFLWRRHNT